MGQLNEQQKKQCLEAGRVALVYGGAGIGVDANLYHFAAYEAFAGPNSDVVWLEFPWVLVVAHKDNKKMVEILAKLASLIIEIQDLGERHVWEWRVKEAAE